MPVVSVIITTFNRSNYLKRAIESVLSQTFTDFELLILDNSSTDDTEKVVKSFDDSRIRYIKHEPLNISQARNLGVKEARGEYVAFLDDDDEWLPHKLEKQLGIFEKSGEEVALVYGGFVRIDSEGNEFYMRKPVLRGRILKGLLYQDDFTGSASNPILRKSVLKDLGGYNEEVTTGEDWDLYLRLAEKYLVEFTSKPVVKIRLHSGPRLGDRLKDAAKLEMMVLDRYSYIFEEDRKLKSFYLQKIGGKFVRCGNASKGRKYFTKAIKARPLNYIAYLQYLISFLGQGLYDYLHSVYLGNRKGSKEIKH